MTKRGASRAGLEGAPTRVNKVCTGVKYVLFGEVRVRSVANPCILTLAY